MIKAICFDLDGVYFKSSGFQLFKDSLIELGAKIDDINLYLHGDPMNAFKRGEVSEGDYWASSIKALGIDITISQVKEMLVKNYAVDPEVQSIVLKAREAGYKTCVCSNNFVTRIRGLNDKFSFLDNFDSFWVHDCWFSYSLLVKSVSMATLLLSRLRAALMYCDWAVMY